MLQIETRDTHPPAPRRPTVGLALGGGGARGLAHVLVLEVLDEMGIRPVAIAGTSIGALFGSAYALGMSGRAIRAMAEETLRNRFDLARQLFQARSDPVQKVLRLLPLRTSLLNSAVLLDLLAPEISNRDFKDLAIPMQVVATDLASHDSVVIESGSLRNAVAASIAIPLVFSPVMHGGRLLVDGGLVNPLPFELVAGKADVTIAIDVSGASKETDLGAQPTAIEVLMRSVQILEKSITREKLARRQPDVYVDVGLDQYGALEFWRAGEILEAAKPVKDVVRRQLTRLITSETVEQLR